MHAISSYCGNRPTNITVDSILVLSSTVTTVASARDLGVVDSQCTKSANVSSTCQSAYCQLRQLRPVVRSLSVDVAKTAVQSFVSTRLDYCNSLMYDIAEGLMQRLQAVQNAAAGLITSARLRDHILPVNLSGSCTGFQSANEFSSSWPC